jgi:hypothetical protein
LKQLVPIGDTKVAFTVKFSQELVRQVRSFASITGLSLSEIVTVSTGGLARAPCCGQWIWREPAGDLGGTVIWQMTSTDLNSNFSSVSKLSKGRGLV